MNQKKNIVLSTVLNNDPNLVTFEHNKTLFGLKVIILIALYGQGAVSKGYHLGEFECDGNKPEISAFLCPTETPNKTPDLVAQVYCSNDKVQAPRYDFERLKEFGVKEFWEVDADERTVTVHVGNDAPYVYKEGEDLNSTVLIRALPVNYIFELPDFDGFFPAYKKHIESLWELEEDNEYCKL